MSIGTAEPASLRGCLREPSTEMTSSVLVSSAASAAVSWAPASAAAIAPPAQTSPAAMPPIKATRSARASRWVRNPPCTFMFIDDPRLKLSDTPALQTSMPRAGGMCVEAPPGAPITLRLPVPGVDPGSLASLTPPLGHMQCRAQKTFTGATVRDRAQVNAGRVCL